MNYRRCFLEKDKQYKTSILSEDIAKLGNTVNGWKITVVGFSVGNKNEKYTMNYRVFIPTAGKGSRLGHRTAHLNKALLKVGNKAVISHTIDAFPKDIQFVIALGYQGDLVRQYLEITYPERNFIFVEIDKLEGLGSGPGYSLFCCKKELQCPFYFVSCDTIIDWKNRLHCLFDWAGWSEIDEHEIKDYCTISVKDPDHCGDWEVSGFHNKSEKGTTNAFTGVACINSYQEFWKKMTLEQSSIKEIEVAPAILSISNICAWWVDWYDTGSETGLRQARECFQGLQNLDKADEEIYFINGNTIKYFRDEDIVKDRLHRVRQLKDVIPKILQSTKNFYKYEFLKGKDLFDIDNQCEIMGSLLKFYKQDLWKDVQLSEIDKIAFKRVCLNFYQSKTILRLKKFFENCNVIDREDIINETNVPKIEDIFKIIDWNWLCDGIPSVFHGDLHFSNTLLLNDGTFKLLDWRQNFGDLINYGDRYYDLAKFYHQFLCPHISIKSKQFSIIEKDGLIKTQIEISENIKKAKNIYECWIVDEGYDLKKVKILTGIIFLNMSPLHENPLDRYLFYFAKKNLYDTLNV